MTDTKDRCHVEVTQIDGQPERFVVFLDCNAVAEAKDIGTARLIASAVNSHAALVEAVRDIIEAADDPDNGKDRDLVEAIDWDALRAALALAEGGGS